MCVVLNCNVSSLSHRENEIETEIVESEYYETLEGISNDMIWYWKWIDWRENTKCQVKKGQRRQEQEQEQ